MKDALELANERIDQMAEYIVRLEKENAAMSDALHKMNGECQRLVTKARHRHFRYAVEHGCPTEYAV